MYTLKGKYNSANIMLPEGHFADDETTRQIYTILNHPAFKGGYICFMPDLHAGKGATIGFTYQLGDYIIPNIVGVDIGCGVWTVQLDKNIPLDYLPKLDNWIRNNIPHGRNVNKERTYNNYECSIELRNKIKNISDKIDSDYYRNLLSIGSLGGGNHFIEIGVDSNGDQWLTVHSGSRKFGLDIANFHQSRAKVHIERNFIKEIPKHLEFLYQDKHYLEDMKVAQEFASTNRLVIINRIQEFLKIANLFDIHSVHNYIDFNDNIIRKGAVSAHENEWVVIPFNMQDGLIIGKGKGNKKWNYSAPHGAGRIMKRRQAKEELNLEEAKLAMADSKIFTTSLNHNTLDEVKGAYKNKDLILDAIQETVEVIDFIKPIYNFKA